MLTPSHPQVLSFVKFCKDQGYAIKHSRPSQIGSVRMILKVILTSTEDDVLFCASLSG